MTDILDEPQINYMRAEVVKWLNWHKGYYSCPKEGVKRLGPLVGYAKKYEDANGAKLQLVGDHYFNIACIDCYPLILAFLSVLFYNAYGKRMTPTCIVAAPLGGIKFAEALGSQFGRGSMKFRTIFAEKRPTKPIEGVVVPGRPDEELFWGRYAVEPGDRCLIVEDLCNNFSTTDELCKLIENEGGQVVGLACVVNRSKDSVFIRNDSLEPGLPVSSLAHIPSPQYRQDDPEVAEDIKAGNIVWKPKHDWERLKKAIQDN